MDYEIFGTVVEPSSGRGVPGVVIAAFDKDPVFDDFLGEVMSTPTGAFRLVYSERKFKSVFDRKPDLYVKVKTVDGHELLDTKGATRFNASAREEFRIELTADVLAKAGLTTSDPNALTPVPRETLTTLTCLAGVPDDDLIKQIKNDVSGAASILEVFKGYMADLKGVSNDALPFRKMARLFELGATPDRMPGHHYGVAPGLRTGDLTGVAADYGNVMGFLWGSVIGDATPWVGKTMTMMTADDRAAVVGDSVPADVPVFRGINHFHFIEHAPLNIALNDVLSVIWHLKEASEAERLHYGYDRNGGHFAGHRARSFYSGTPRDVFRLNYRIHALGNHWPLMYLVDELVEIASGLFLGQVLFATDHLLEQFDPAAPPERYHYQHFGYFLLLREWWHPEAQRLFPDLNLPDADIETRTVGPVPRPAPRPKFTTLTLAPPGDGNVDAAALAEVKADLQQAGTVIDLIKSYSNALQQELDTRSPVFGKLQALFNAGIGPSRVEGFYRGALVSWQVDGLLAAARLNGIDVAWHAVRSFSPWTGKRFDPIDKPRLAALTDGWETGEVDTFFCANTVAFRTAKQRFVRALARAAHAPLEDATPEEHRRYGFDAKTFFFLAKQAPSIYPANAGKKVFQFNYRWKALHNPIPDCFCIDEIVQIAEGLYLGQLFYSMDWLVPWDPRTELAKYKYGLFAYFALMDEEWHARRLKIGYDLENT
ncbi:MAG TPA: hypothetical protein VHW23_07040 [Kofleriaceae bacterium]|jgi:hypothetical protein|nr:hypothetical protein [Kofleriaceae bacterium]